MRVVEIGNWKLEFWILDDNPHSRPVAPSVDWTDC
jgi:hypothetical protein